VLRGLHAICACKRAGPTVRRRLRDPEEIFVSYEELKLKYGKEIEKLPLGAIGIYTASQKNRTGLQQ